MCCEAPLRLCVDVISEFLTLYPGYIAFTKEEADFRKQALPFVVARYIRTSEAFSEHGKHFFGV